MDCAKSIIDLGSVLDAAEGSLLCSSHDDAGAGDGHERAGVCVGGGREWPSPVDFVGLGAASR